MVRPPSGCEVLPSSCLCSLSSNGRDRALQGMGTAQSLAVDKVFPRTIHSLAKRRSSGCSIIPCVQTVLPCAVVPMRPAPADNRPRHAVLRGPFAVLRLALVAHRTCSTPYECCCMCTRRMRSFHCTSVRHMVTVTRVQRGRTANGILRMELWLTLRTC